MENHTDEQIDLHAEWGEALLWVIAVDKTGNATAVGNAFIVGAGGDAVLALTAWHVVDAIGKLSIKNSAFKDYREALAHPQFESALHRVIGIRGADKGILQFDRFSSPPPDLFDVAACLVKAPKTGPIARFGVKFSPPDVGTTVWTTGWSGAAKLYQQTEELPAEWRFSGLRTNLVGKVIGSYMRRQGVTKGPCFEVEGHFPSGLSGSPVVSIIDGRPYVCGVVSDSDGTTAVAAMLWPALVLPVPADVEEGQATIHELAKRGFLDVAPGDLDRFEVDGSTVTADTRPQGGDGPAPTPSGEPQSVP